MSSMVDMSPNRVIAMNMYIVIPTHTSIHVLLYENISSCHLGYMCLYLCISSESVMIYIVYNGMHGFCYWL